MAKKKRELTTRRMSSGAQQYVREGVETGPREMSSPTTRRMKTIDDTIRALDRSTVRREPKASRLLTDAFIDESRSAQKARETERQTIDEDRANRRADRREEGGAVLKKKKGERAGSNRNTPAAERNRGSVDRARAKRGSGQASQEAETPPMRFREVPDRMPAGEPAPTRPTPRPARASTLAPTSTRDKPVPRPAGLAERADLRKAMDSSDAALRASKREAADREMGMKAGGKVKKMQAGGKCRGMGAATRGGNFSRG